MSHLYDVSVPCLAELQLDYLKILSVDQVEDNSPILTAGLISSHYQTTLTVLSKNTVKKQKYRTDSKKIENHF